MIFCNQCGESVPDGMRFCTDCGTEVIAASQQPLTTTPLSMNPVAIQAMVRDYTPQAIVLPPQPAYDSGNPSGSSETTSNDAVAATRQTNMKIAIGIVGSVAVLGIALAIYFGFSKSPSALVAETLRNSVASGRIVTGSNDDSYAYYTQLKSLDPNNKALAEIKGQVLPQLRKIGESAVRSKLVVGVNSPEDNQDWGVIERACRFAHELEPADRTLESRWRFAEGESAKRQLRLADAERSFSAAAQLDSSWALPQNSLGLLRSERKDWGASIPYYQRANELQPNWEIPYNNMGTAYLNLKNFDAAIPYYRKAIELNANWARPHYWLGEIYDQQRNKAAALYEYQQALRLDPTGISLGSKTISYLQRRVNALQR